MLSGVNCDLQAAKLASFTNGLDTVVNLIPWNAAELWTTPTTQVKTFTKYLDGFMKICKKIY